MAIESVVANAGSGGSSFAVDTISGSVQVPYAKLMSGTDTSEELIGGDAANGLDVDVTRMVPGTGATALGKAEDAVHASGDTGVAMLGVRRDTAASGAGTDGDYATINLDASGRLWTNGSGVTQPISDASGSLTVDSPQLPSAAGQHAAADSLSVVLASDQATIPVSAAALPLPSGAATAANQATGNTSLATLAGAVAGTEVQVDVLTSALPAGASTEATLAAASAKLPAALGQTTMAASMSVALASNQSALPITDNSGSLTMDSGQMPATLGQKAMSASMAVVLASDQASIPVAATLAAGTNTNEVVGDVAHDAAASGNPLLVGGYASAAAPTDVSADADAVRAWHLRNGAAATVLTAAGALIGGDAANGLDVDITRMPNVTLAAGTNTNEVVGDAAHDAAIAGNPIRLAGRALSADYTAVAAGDTADLQTDLNGKLVVMPYSIPELSVSGATAAITGTSDTSVIASPGAGLRNYITQILVTNSHATVGTVVEIKSATTVLYRGFAAALGGGFAINFPKPLRCAANEALNAANITTGSNTYVSASGYTAP